MLRPTSLLAGLALAATTLGAAPAGASRARWHLEAGPSAWLNARVQFGASAAADPSLAPRTDRTYDDGFNRVDASGNVGDGAAGPLASRTGYFGFNNDAQVDLRAGTLALHRLSAASGGYLSERRTDVRPGGDVAARLSLASATAHCDWGLAAGLGWARFKESSSGAEAATLRLLTDAYPLGGVVPQRAPYAGRFSPLPGDQRIGDTPVRSLAAVAGTASGTHAFSARTTVARLGGWFELVPARGGAGEAARWSLLAQAGPALVATRASFSVDEQLQTSGSVAPARVTAGGSRRRTDLGGFAGLRLRRAFNDRTALVAWGDYLAGSRLTVPGGERTARLDLSQAFVVGLALELRWGR